MLPNKFSIIIDYSFDKTAIIEVMNFYCSKIYRSYIMNILGWKCDEVDDCGDNSDESVNICRK